MSFYSISSPYKAGYAIPKYVKKEPIGRGTHTTAQRRRGSIDVLPKVPKAGYAVPRYVQKEVPGMGTFTTAWLPRGSVSQLPPDSLAPHSLSGTSLSGSSLGGSSLGDAMTSNPMAKWASESASAIMIALNRQPVAERTKFLKTLLGEIDGRLYTRAMSAQRANIKAGMSSSAALRQALETTLATGLTQEFIRLGQGAQMPLGGFLDKVKKYTNKVLPYTNPLSAQAAIVSGASGAKDLAKKIGSAACKAANNKFAGAAAAGVSAAYGAPPQAGMTGVAVAQQLCTEPPPPPTPGIFQTGPSWLVPVALGGGALLLVLALRR